MIRQQFNITLDKLLHLHVHFADLIVKWVVVEQVGAVELLAVGLAHGDDVLPSFEDLNLEIMSAFIHVSRSRSSTSKEKKQLEKLEAVRSA